MAVTSRAAPTITTEVRPISQGRMTSWQVTVTTPLAEALAKPLEFARHRARRPARRPSTVIVTDAHRPAWVGFAPRPRTVRRFAATAIYHHSQRLTPLKVIPPYDNRRVYRDWSSGSGRAMTCGADLTYGQSGSPIFGFWGTTPYAVAVVSAESDGDNYCVGGSDLPDLVKQVRAAHP